MNTFSWGKAIGFGVLLWIIMFVIASILGAVGVSLTTGVWVILAVVAGLLSYSFAANADPDSSGTALGYGIVWAIVGLALDLIISAQFQSGIFNTGVYWLGYALILFAPLVEFGAQGTAHHTPA